jgi:glycosyltransferase involved in cell wall biosynthesis
MIRTTLASAGVDPQRIDIVYPGVPTPVVEEPRNWRTECRWPADAVICGIVGAGADGSSGLVASLAERLSPGARRRARLLVFGGAGSGPCTIGGVESFRAGFVDEVQPALAGVDVLLHLATTPTLGTAVIDAMSLRIPPIAFAISGLSELIETDRTGILVPAGDVDGLAAAVSEIVVDDAGRERLARHGPARAAEFSVDAMVSAMEAGYRKAIPSAY